MVKDYRNLDFEIYVRLHDLRNILRHYEVENDFYDLIDGYMELIRTKQYRVAVIGEFSRGKSSLLNALLGSRILPADITPTTATINRIRFDMDSHVDLRYRDGTVSEIDIGELESYVTKLTKENEATADVIEEAVIYYPTVICQNNIELIDTPGLNEDVKMTELTVSQLEKIDAAIVLISALSPLDQIEKDLIVSLVKSPEIDCIIFVVSFVDQIDPEEREYLYEGINKRIRSVYDYIKQKFGDDDPITAKAERMLERAKCYGVSAYQALSAIEKNDMALLHESCLPDFQKELYRILTAEQSRNALVKTLRMIAQSGERIDGWYAKKKAALEAVRERDIENKQKLEAFCDGLDEYFNSVIREHMRPADEYSDYADLYGALTKICVENLGAIEQNRAECILNAIEHIDDGINAYAAKYVKLVSGNMASDAQKCTDAIDDFLRDSFFSTVAELAPNMLLELSEFIKTAASTLSDMPAELCIRYSFFDPGAEANGRYVPSRDFIPSNICYEIADLRHYNYIGYMRRQAGEFTEHVIGLLGKYAADLRGVILNIKDHLHGRRGELSAVAEQKIKNSDEDLLVNDKMFIKHRDDMAALADYSNNMIKNIQREESK